MFKQSKNILPLWIIPYLHQSVGMIQLQVKIPKNKYLNSCYTQ